MNPTRTSMDIDTMDATLLAAAIAALEDNQPATYARHRERCERLFTSLHYAARGTTDVVLNVVEASA